MCCLSQRNTEFLPAEWASSHLSYDVSVLSTHFHLSHSFSTLIILLPSTLEFSLFCFIYGDNCLALFNRGDSVGNWSSYRSSLRCMWWCVSGSRQIIFLPIAQHVRKAWVTILCLLCRYLMSGWGLMASSDDKSSTFCISLLSIYLVCSWFISNVRRVATQATSLVRTWVTAWASYCRLIVTGRAMFTLKTPQC